MPKKSNKVFESSSQENSYHPDEEEEFVDGENDIVEEDKRQGAQNSQSRTRRRNKGSNAESENQNEKYVCKCGKAYGAAASIYTHIKTKHQHAIKQYQKAITKPKGNKPEERKHVFKLRDIVFNQLEVELMNEAEITVMNIYQKLQEIKSKDILIKHELDQAHKKDRESRQQKYYQDIGLDQMFSKLDLKRSLADFTFKIERYTLSLKRELSKHFNDHFYFRIAATLNLLSLKDQNESTGSTYSQNLAKIWNKNQIKAVTAEIEQLFAFWKQRISEMIPQKDKEEVQFNFDEFVQQI